MISIFKIKNPFKEPVFPKEHSLTKVASYLIESHESTINYYKAVFFIGCLGIAISLILSFILIINYSDNNCGYSLSAFFKCDWSIILKIKIYPAFIYSLITAAFGQMEIELNKKELYKKLKEISLSSDNWSSTNIVSNYQAWTWEEFKQKFNP